MRQEWALICVLALLVLKFTSTRKHNRRSHHTDDPQDVFFNHMSDEELLQEIMKAEKELKIYIYPAPGDSITRDFQKNRERAMLPHFKAE
jgi:hypothetical protein